MSKRRIVKERKIIKTEPKKTEKPVEAQGWSNMLNWMLILIIILPVIFSRFTLDPNITVRYLFLSSFILLFTLFFYVIKKTTAILTGHIKLVFALGIAFGLWSGLMLVTAVNPSAGYYETARNFLNVILLFLIFVTAQKEESKLLRICKAILLVSIIQSFVGILQFYDVAFSDLPGANAKPFGLMANRNLFGSAQALVIPFVIYVLYYSRKLWKYLGFIAISGIIISLIISQTRSSWISASIMLLVSFILLMIFIGSLRKIWIISVTILIVYITALVMLLMVTDQEGILSTSIKERISTNPAAKNATESVNANERLKIWSKTFELIKDNPVTGVGLGNWKIIIPQYGTEGLAWANGKFVPDRPHNVYLQILAETGIPGAILYFGMWLVIAIIAITVLSKKNYPDNKKILVVLMLAGLAGFAADCMFSFPTERIEHSLYIMLMAGIILGSSTDYTNDKQQKVSSVIIGTILLLSVLNIFMGFKKYNFETHMNLAAAYEKSKRYQDVLTETEEGKNMFVTIDQTGKSLEVYSSLAYKEIKDYDNAIKEAKTAKRNNPNSSMVYNNLGTIYTDMKMYDSAVNNYLRAIKFTPHFEILYKNLAVNYFQLGNFEACVDALNHVTDREKDNYLNNFYMEAKRRMELKVKMK